jgi:hypothetical protein
LPVICGVPGVRASFLPFKKPNIITHVHVITYEISCDHCCRRGSIEGLFIIAEPVRWPQAGTPLAVLN